MNNYWKNLSGVLAVILLAAANAHSEVIYLKDGQVIHGTILDEAFKVKTQFGENNIKLSLIDSVNFNGFAKDRKTDEIIWTGKYADAEFQLELSGILVGMSTSRGQKLAIAAPRESAKSTIVSLQYVIYCICYKVEDFIVIISSTADQAVNFLSNIKQELERNDLLWRDFPEVCEIGRKPGPPRWSQKDIVTRNCVKVIALGVGQQIRGRRNKEHRPSLIILDDVETDESFQTPDAFNKLQDWLTKAVLKSGTSTTNVVYVGTIHHYNSLLAQFTNPTSHSGWIKKIYRSVINWSERFDLWEKWVKIFNYQEEYEGESGHEAAKRFFKAKEMAMLKGTKVLWPENKSYYELMVMREQDGCINKL